MNVQFELLPGSFRSEHKSYGSKSIRIDNYVIHLKSGFENVLKATKSYIKEDCRAEHRNSITITEVMLSKSIATEFINTVMDVVKPIFDFYSERFKDVNITLFNIRMVSLNIILDELLGQDDSWKNMIPYTNISKLTKYGIHIRNFIDDILRYMFKEYQDLKLDIIGMDLYKFSPHVLIHTCNDTIHIK